ncbi:MAG: MATE family efflux transporter, partial [Candidatus Neomarinimicrobiota bacterium]|nr:MATE family efflux transporter [Candidatus Neomarinimicrobiota bacterium]
MDSHSESKSRLKIFLDNPSKALWSLAIPIMFGMGIQTLYNLVDMIFIGRLGGQSIAGIAFNMPLFFLVLGLTMGLGTGVTASIARFICQNNKKEADNSAEHAIFMAVVISLFLSSLGLLFGERILSLFGAEGEILSIGWEYLHVMCFGMPFMIFSGFFRSILAGEGDMKLPMMVAGLGTVLNIILDPIFIFDLENYGGLGFGLGVAGAAMATVISQAIVFCVFIYMLFVKEHSYITFRLKDFSFSSDIIWDIVKVGLPASLSMVVMAIGQGVFNKILIHFSADTVAAYQVAGRLDMLVFLPIFSIAASLTTLVGMFFGAKEYDILRFTIKYGIISAFCITVLSSVLIYLFADLAVGFFTDDEFIISIAVTFLKLFAFVYPLISIGITTGRVLQGLGKGLPVLVITIVRVLGVSAPLAFLFI